MYNTHIVGPPETATGFPKLDLIKPVSDVVGHYSPRVEQSLLVAPLRTEINRPNAIPI